MKTTALESRQWFVFMQYFSVKQVPVPSIFSIQLFSIQFSQQLNTPKTYQISDISFVGRDIYMRLELKYLYNTK